MSPRAFHGWLCYRTTVPLVLISLSCAFSFISLLSPHFLLHTTYTSAKTFPPLPSFGSSPVPASPTFHSPSALPSYFLLLHPLHGREHDYCIGNCLLRSPQLLAFPSSLFSIVPSLRSSSTLHLSSYLSLRLQLLFYLFLFSVTAWTSLRGFLRAPPTTPPTSRIPLFPLPPHLFHPLQLQSSFMSPEFSRLQVPCVTSVKIPEAMGLPRPPLFGDSQKKVRRSLSLLSPLFS